MGFIYNFIKRLLRLSIYTAIIFILIIVIPNIPPYTSFTSIPLEPPLAREGPLAPNTDLNNADKVFVNKLLGPEAFQIYNGELYTGLGTGEIVKISPSGHVTFVTKLGQPCSGIVHEHICGRPLGFEIDEKNRLLYVADAYLGIWKVSLKDDKKTLLVSPRVAINGRNPKLFNAVVMGKNGDLYWTDSTSDYQLKDATTSLLSDPSGRLFQYNAATNKSTVLLDNIWFPNGLVVSPNNDYIIVVETARFRLLKYYIEGPKKGKSEVFIAGLPGTPDNIRALPDGSGVLVGLYVTYDDENPMLSRSMTETPLVRKLLARIQRLVEIPFEYLNTVFPHIVFEEIVYNIGHFKSLAAFIPKQSGLLYIDWNGNVISSHYNTDGSLGHVSDAIVFNDRLYTGSPHLQNYIGSVPVPPALKKAFQGKSAQKPVETVKPKVEKPKEVKREAPKPIEEKPVQKQTKPVEAPKPTPKPVEQPKPAKSTPSPQAQQPKKETKPEARTPPPTPKPEVKTTPPPTPKAEVKTTPPPPTKPVTKTTPEVKSTTAKPEVKSEKAKKEEKPVTAEKKSEQIPIREEIPSDTVKPPKETLKVIKKGGPAEIPNPNL